MALKLPAPGLIITLIGFFGLMFWVNKTAHKAQGLLAVFAFTGFLGYTPAEAHVHADDLGDSFTEGVGDADPDLPPLDEDALGAIGVKPAQQKMRVQQIWHWLYVRGATDFEQMTSVSMNTENACTTPWLPGCGT